MNIQVGSASQRLPGFLNVDIRQVEGVDIVAHAGDLRPVVDGSVDILFNSAFFEHVFVPQQPVVLREWKRVLAPSGIILALGIPDFATIARCYLTGARGIVGPRFDLFNVYRYTHGSPENASERAWSTWQPDRTPDAAPAGWIPQLHKGLFDADYVYELMDHCGLAATVFNYAFPGEEHPLNLGAIGMTRESPAAPSLDAFTADDIRRTLGRVETIERFVDLGTVTRAPRRGVHDLMMIYVREIGG
jgi:SAM-dependent methyltransferase